MEILYYLSISTFYIKLKNRQLMFKLPKAQKILFAILSFKTGKVIGYRFQNLKGVFNYIFTENEFNYILLNAIEEYYGLKRILLEDKKGNIKAKIIEFKKNQPNQNMEYNNIIEPIFPGLISKKINLDEFL